MYALRLFPTDIVKNDNILKFIERVFPVKSQFPMTRLGPNGDGGYILPNDLEGITACYSPGVSFVSDFENDCAKRGMQVFLADRSVDGPAVQNDAFHFTKKYIGAFDTDEFMTLDTWVEQTAPDPKSDLLLQIDIEGFEYEVFLNMTEKLQRRFRTIVVEFHMMDQLWNAPFNRIITRTFDKLLQTHACVHIHPNNCCGSVEKDGLVIPRVMEFTFHRLDRVLPGEYQTKFPTELDFDNTTNATLPLPKMWYKNN